MTEREESESNYLLRDSEWLLSPLYLSAAVMKAGFHHADALRAFRHAVKIINMPPKKQLRAPELDNIDFKTNCQMSKALLVITSWAGRSAAANGSSQAGWMFSNRRLVSAALPGKAVVPSKIKVYLSASCLVEHFWIVHVT